MNQNLHKTSSSHFDLKEMIKTYTKHWLWFLSSIVLTTAFAYTYLRYSVPEYAAEASIQILEGKSSSPELSVFQDLGILQGGSNPIADEFQILKSRSNFIEVVKELHLNLRVYAVGNILDSELYTNPPIKINFIESDSIINSSNFEFFIEIFKETTTFGYAEDVNAAVKIYSYGKNIPSPVGEIVITPNVVDLKKITGRRFKIVLTPVTSVATMYQYKTEIIPSDKSSNIIEIYLTDPIQKKAKDIIGALINIYNRNDVEDKKNVADKTSAFIDNRIAIIYSNLSNVDQNAEEFKSQRGLTDIANEANINLTMGASNKQELQSAYVQLNMAEYMGEFVDNQDAYDFLPSNIGLSDPTIRNTTAKWNELISTRQRLLKSSGEKNPIIVELNQRLDGLKQNLKSSLNTMKNNLGLQVNSLSKQASQINSRIYSVPENERALREITRKQGTTEALYLYLLQKREESQIAFASAFPKSKIINKAYGVGSQPVSPIKENIYLSAFLLGFLLPFSVIYASDLLDNKVHNKISLEKLVEGMPIIGELPRLTKKENKLIQNNDRSVLAESLRILRTNLNYLMKSKNALKKENIIFITSSTSGEGKTFISSNLSVVLASTNKKVLLIGADIRNPKLYTFFSGDQIDKMSKYVRNKDAGLTEYLYDDKLNIKDIINPMLVYENTIDVVYSGRIPPNPAELLMSNRLKEMFNEVSEIYDYVIVDTAPLMVVADTLLISDYADHMVYVTRAHVTEEKAVYFPLKLQKEGKINGLSFIVNDVRSTNLGYGGKYGYGYGKTMKKWWKL